MLDPSKIPAGLRDARRWLLWRYEPNHDPSKKPRKVPFYISGRKRGATDTPKDREALAPFEEVREALSAGGWSGAGFALGDGFQGVDIDEAEDHNLLDVVAALPGYRERSPSGKGFHAIGYGPAFSSLGSNGSGIEAYASGRFFTVTGIEGQGELEDLAGFVNETLRPRHQTASQAPQKALDLCGEMPLQEHVIRDLESALQAIPADDRSVWVSTGHALKTVGDQGRKLWMDWSATCPEKFDKRDAARAWDSFKPTATGHAAVFKTAEGYGWQNPAKSSQPAAGEWRRAEVAQGFRFIPVRELLSSPKPTEWLITDLIEEGTLCQLFGASQAGKSFMAIDWAASIATGRDWNGREVAQGCVFYIAGEGHGGIARRLRAWEIHSGQGLADSPLYVSSTSAALIDEGSAAAVSERIATLEAKHGKPKLIVIDTLARNIGNGEESSNADISRLINNLDTLLKSRFDAAVLIVHHTGHGDQERARGASALRAAVDHEYRMDVKDGLRLLVTTKNKEGEIPEPLAFRLESVPLDWLDGHGMPMSSAALVPAAPLLAARQPLKGAKLLALDALRQAVAEKGQPPSSEALAAAGEWLAPAAVVPEDTWRRYAYAAGISSGEGDAKRKAFVRQRDALLAESHICRHGDEWWPLSP